jgi:hypothetical protein
MNHWINRRKLIGSFLTVTAILAASLGLCVGIAGYPQSNELFKMMTEQAPVTNGVTSGAARLNKPVDINATAETSATKADDSLAAFHKILSLSTLVAVSAIALLFGFVITPLPARKTILPPGQCDQATLVTNGAPLNLNAILTCEESW